MSTQEIFKVQASVDEALPASKWMPTADNDFFAADITDEDYDFTNR